MTGKTFKLIYSIIVEDKDHFQSAFDALEEGFQAIVGHTLSTEAVLLEETVFADRFGGN